MTATVTSRTGDSRPKRAFCSHQPKWQRFQPTLLKPETKKAEEKEKETYQYQRQYSHVYSQRLTALRGRCWQQFETLTTTDVNYTRINRVLELREDVPSRVVGTLVKEANDPSEPPIHGECRPSDQLFLEDESGRVALKLDHVHRYCTGVIVGVQGKVDKVGTFHVEELVLPAAPPHPSLDGTATMLPATVTNTDGSESEQAPHLLIVSSLLCGDPNVPSLPREMLIAYLQGQFTKDAAKVCRVLVVGGGPSQTQDLLHGVKEFDAFCLQLTKAGIPVDVMPGKNDPTTANWPQRPLHSSLLPHATAILHRTPNPYAAAMGPRLILATDGANVDDLQQRSLTIKEDGTLVPSTELEALKRTLEWSHLCPTGPDSVPTVPHLDQDPMVLEQLPHLYICGYASKFATSTTNTASGNDDSKTTMICVPSFATSGEAVLVNLETMGVELLRFEDQEA